MLDARSVHLFSVLTAFFKMLQVNHGARSAWERVHLVLAAAGHGVVDNKIGKQK
jgi:hypothetical protein